MHAQKETGLLCFSEEIPWGPMDKLYKLEGSYQQDREDQRQRGRLQSLDVIQKEAGKQKWHELEGWGSKK